MKKDKFISASIFVALVTLALAIMEIQIEGTGNWARNLPTWRPFGYLAPTGYHFAMWTLMLVMFHMPFFVGYAPWTLRRKPEIRGTLRSEAEVLALIAIVAVFEDFWWYVLNPAWSARIFMQTATPHWPITYSAGIAISILFAWGARKLSRQARILGVMAGLTLILVLGSGFFWRKTDPVTTATILSQSVQR
ncbi:MAG: hypothetical protein NTY61_01595 [Candidatus Parcubacteria bacterium]|nr:hypothetical protein [Candidatus Parcubacteria bacterium]